VAMAAKVIIVGLWCWPTLLETINSRSPGKKFQDSEITNISVINQFTNFS
jgi:hypothetical protein